MLETIDKLSADIEMVQSISIVPTMLDVVCKTTGMGFSAIARVTNEKWIACSVQDEIAFGLKPGGELELKSTICNEIRDSRKPVVIDHVSEDAQFCNHHTPAQYHFQSYISFPIILKNGEFFGTLCAIDPNPASLNNPKILGMFEMFTDLISFHLESLDLMERSRSALNNITRQLSASIDENRQYQYISNHNLQEPLRKIRLFSNMLIDAVQIKNEDKAKDYAVKIDHNAKKISMMIKDLSGFSELNHTDESFEIIGLNKIISDVSAQLQSQLQSVNAVLHTSDMPEIRGIRLQLEQLFYHLISNAVKFSRKEEPLVVVIDAHLLSEEESKALDADVNHSRFVEVRISDNGIGIEKSQLERIFDIFSQLHYSPTLEGFGVGLAYCRKIIRNHNGYIKAQSQPGAGTTFSLILPLQ